MSIDRIVGQIASIDREINTTEKSIHSIAANIPRKSKETNGILTKISREKDLTVIMTIRDPFTDRLVNAY